MNQLGFLKIKYRQTYYQPTTYNSFFIHNTKGFQESKAPSRKQPKRESFENLRIRAWVPDHRRPGRLFICESRRLVSTATPFTSLALCLILHRHPRTERARPALGIAAFSLWSGAMAAKVPFTKRWIKPEVRPLLSHTTARVSFLNLLFGLKLDF